MKKDIREETVIVLDFLPNGYPFDSTPMHQKTPIAQALGKDHFILLELVPKKGIFLQPYEEVYVGEKEGLSAGWNYKPEEQVGHVQKWKMLHYGSAGIVSGMKESLKPRIEDASGCKEK